MSVNAAQETKSNAVDINIAIVGAGIAGLVSAKTFLENGFAVTVFEKEPTLGGVWAASRTYPGLRANNSKLTYSFSDYPYPESVSPYPEAHEIRTYLESYADHFAVRPHIRFNYKVVELAEHTRDGESGFRLSVQNTEHSDSSETLYFSHVVICNGPFSTPNLADIPGRDRYQGRVRHSSQCTDPKVADAQSVIVIGSGKSGLDCAAWAAREGKQSALVFRKAHWMAPRYLPGGSQSDLRMISRLTELFIDYPNRSRFERVLHGLGKPLVKLWWAMQNWILPRASKMPPLLVPDRPLPDGFESIGQVDDFYDLLNEGRIAARREGIKTFTETGLELANGEHISADLVIFATGWKRNLSFLDDAIQAKVFRAGRFRLFRRILPPELPQLAFVGYFPTLACQLSSEIAAHWVTQCFSGQLALPPVAQMDAEITKIDAWANRRLPDSEDGIFTGPYQAHYVDDLMRDLGMPTKRASNFLTEYLGTFLPTRYATLGRELEQLHDSGAPGRSNFYLSGTYALLALIVIGVLVFAFI